MEDIAISRDGMILAVLDKMLCSVDSIDGFAKLVRFKELSWITVKLGQETRSFDAKILETFDSFIKDFSFEELLNIYEELGGLRKKYNVASVEKLRERSIRKASEMVASIKDPSDGVVPVEIIGGFREFLKYLRIILIHRPESMGSSKCFFNRVGRLSFNDYMDLIDCLREAPSYCLKGNHDGFKETVLYAVEEAFNTASSFEDFKELSEKIKSFRFLENTDFSIKVTKTALDRASSSRECIETSKLSMRCDFLRGVIRKALRYENSFDDCFRLFRIAFAFPEKIDEIVEKALSQVSSFDDCSRLGLEYSKLKKEYNLPSKNDLEKRIIDKAIEFPSSIEECMFFFLNMPYSKDRERILKKAYSLV